MRGAEPDCNRTFDLEVEGLNIGDSVKHYRLAKGMTQTQLGDAVGVTESMICQIERGTKALTVPLGKAIARALNVSPAVLFGIESDDQPA